MYLEENSKYCLLGFRCQYGAQTKWGILADSSPWLQNLPPIQGMFHFPPFSTASCKSCFHRAANHLRISSPKPYIINSIRKYWNCSQSLSKKRRGKRMLSRNTNNNLYLFSAESNSIWKCWKKKKKNNCKYRCFFLIVSFFPGLHSLQSIQRPRKASRPLQNVLLSSLDFQRKEGMSISGKYLFHFSLGRHHLYMLHLLNKLVYMTCSHAITNLWKYF